MPTLRPQWVLFGDSITQRGFGPGGWASVLADAYTRKVDVINRGYSGYTSRWAVHLLDQVFPPQAAADVQLATVFFGANDAALPDRTSAKQHVPLQEYSDNIRAIVAHLRGAGVSHILLITPPPISEPHRLSHIFATYGVQLPEAERTNAVAETYAVACAELGAELGLPVVHTWREFTAVEGWEETLLNDGLHLTPEGNQLLSRLVQAAILKAYPALTPEALPWDLPEWADVADASDPAAAVRRHLSGGKP